MRAIFTILAFVLGLAGIESSFITPLEYAKMLYFNPHGIGCDKCHKKNGEGGLIADYVKNERQKSSQAKLLAPDIRGLEFNKFKSAITSAKGIMPNYSLTDDEIKALYLYLNSTKDLK